MTGVIRAAVTQIWYDVDSDISAVYGPYRYGLHHCYSSLLDKNGILPMAVLPVKNTTPEELLDGFDMLVLTGGGDPSPALFGRQDLGSRNPETARPLWDIELYRTASALGMPVLGICLGMQLMAIARGTPLIQDIGSSVEGALFHDGSALQPVFHDVSIRKGSLLYSSLGAERLVSSYHHQALESVPTGFSAAAVSGDGIIEAIESDNGMEIGVQWHPERDSTGSQVMRTMLRRAGKQ